MFVGYYHPTQLALLTVALEEQIWRTNEQARKKKWVEMLKNSVSLNTIGRYFQEKRLITIQEAATHCCDKLRRDLEALRKEWMELQDRETAKVHQHRISQLTTCRQLRKKTEQKKLLCGGQQSSTTTTGKICQATKNLMLHSTSDLLRSTNAQIHYLKESVNYRAQQRSRIAELRRKRQRIEKEALKQLPDDLVNFYISQHEWYV